MCLWCMMCLNTVSYVKAEFNKWSYLCGTTKSWVNFSHGRMVYVLTTRMFIVDIDAKSYLLGRFTHLPPAMSVVVNDWHLPSSPESSQQRRLFSPEKLILALEVNHSKYLAQGTNLPLCYKVGPTPWYKLYFRTPLRSGQSYIPFETVALLSLSSALFCPFPYSSSPVTYQSITCSQMLVSIQIPRGQGSGLEFKKRLRMELGLPEKIQDAQWNLNFKKKITFFFWYKYIHNIE